MFKVIDESIFTRDVPVMTPIDGGFEEQSLKTVFRLIETDEAEKFDTKTSEGTDGLLERIVVTFKDLTNEKDEPIPCDDALRRRLLNRPNVWRAIIKAYFDAATKVKEGN
ncbi:MAG: hypothetical protein ACRC9K_12175 [Afipia sp.]